MEDCGGTEVQTLFRVSRNEQEPRRAAEAVWNLETKADTLKTVRMLFGVSADVLVPD